jgi:putative membrane protein
MYAYIKALHIIFVVTWFSGLFYIVRLFIYNREANDKPEPEKKLLQQQFGIMIRRLWFGITWPSAVLTLIFGLSMWYMLGSLPVWLAVKLCFVLGLFAYHLSIHVLYLQQSKADFRYSSQQLRIWNEVATVFLVAIIFLAVVKQSLSWVWALGGLFALMLVLMAAIRVYKAVRTKQSK